MLKLSEAICGLMLFAKNEGMLTDEEESLITAHLEELEKQEKKEAVTPVPISRFRRPDDGNLDSEGLCIAMGIDYMRLMKLLGMIEKKVEVGMIHYMPTELRPQAEEFFEKLEELFNLMLAAIGDKKTPTEFIDWFKLPNKELKGASPLDKIYELNVDILLNKFKDILFAAQGG